MLCKTNTSLRWTTRTGAESFCASQSSLTPHLTVPTLVYKYMVNECFKFHIGPAGDHTTGTGNFMYMDSSSPRQLLDRTRLTHSNLFPAGRGVCTLRFYYNMYGSKLMGYLKVYLLTSGYSRWSEVWKTRGACYHNAYYASQLSATPRKFAHKVLR